MKPRLAEAAAARSVNHLFWFRRAADVRQAIFDGWSTYRIAVTYSLAPQTVRELRRAVEAEA